LTVCFAFMAIPLLCLGQRLQASCPTRGASAVSSVTDLL